MKKTVLFDLDGTVTDPREGIFNCVKYAYRAAGMEIPPDDALFSYIGPPLLDGFQEIGGMTYEEAVEATAKYRERYSVTGLFENRRTSCLHTDRQRQANKMHRSPPS